MRKDSTLSFFDQRRPDAIEHLMPAVPAAPHRLPLQALSWRRNEGPTSWSDVVASILSPTSADAIYFLDSSFLHRQEIPREVFDALLSRTIAITKPIWDELRDWLETPFANACFRDVLVEARGGGGSSVIFVDPGNWRDEIAASVRYYTALLSTRKYYGVSLTKMAAEKGRELTTEQLTSHLQSVAGDRGMQLARKGLLDQSKANFATDEDLVVTAVVHAIQTGRPVLILTRDRDTLEQFRKFNYLLDTHYRSCLIAESFADTPDNLIVEEGLLDDPGKALGISQTSVLDLPRRFLEWTCPKTGFDIEVSCHRFAGDGERMKFASLEFTAHSDMLRLLRVKGRTSGRNIDFAGSRNCHIAVSPPFHPDLGGHAILCTDDNIEFGNFIGPRIDVEYAVQEVQRFRNTVVNYSMNKVPGGTPGMKLADFFLRERLMFSCDPGWRDLSWDELSVAVRYFDAAAIFLVDSGVLEILPDAARSILIERRPWWTTRIRESSIARAQNAFSSRELQSLEKLVTVDLKVHAPHHLGFGHYLALLALRKQYATIIRRRVGSEHGRECGDEEVKVIADHYGGIRARRLAEYGERSARSAELFDGDELLVYGMTAAVMEGADVVFLTRDPAFMDQLAKLGCLLREDYVASQFGRRRPAELEKMQRPIGPSAITDSVGDAVACRLHPGWKSELLPSKPYLINIHCWLLGKSVAEGVRLAAMTFCAERGMHHLLRIKGTTGGRNVEDPDGRNIRAGDIDGDEPVISIWHDKLIPIDSDNFPYDRRLDLRVTSVPAADTIRIHMNEEGLSLPWHESGTSPDA